jgi:hypothetical protein
MDKDVSESFVVNMLNNARKSFKNIGQKHYEKKQVGATTHLN